MRILLLWLRWWPRVYHGMKEPSLAWSKEGDMWHRYRDKASCPVCTPKGLL